MRKLRISREIMSPYAIAIGVDCDLKLLHAERGDFNKGSEKISLLAAQILALGSIERVVVYGKDPRVIEVVKSDNSTDFKLDEIFDIIARTFSDGSYELVDHSLISTEAAAHSACD